MVFHPRCRAVACAGTGSEPEFGVRIKDRGLCRIKSDAGYLAGAQLALAIHAETEFLAVQHGPYQSPSMKFIPASP
jgi:hypothetical protein